MVLSSPAPLRTPIRRRRTLESKYIVEMKGISKQFGSVQALNQVDLELREGEILGLVGDNAAGKSTLMKILSGAHVARQRADLTINGEEVSIREPRNARRQRHRNDLPGTWPCATIWMSLATFSSAANIQEACHSLVSSIRKKCIPNLPRCSKG